MNTKRIASLAAAGAMVVLACVIPPRAEGQNLARRLSGVKNGTVRMSFAARKDICGFENGISTNAKESSRSRSNWNSDRSEDVAYDTECSDGPARVVAHFQDGQLTKIRTYVGGRWRPAGAEVTDVGTVSVKDAADYLLSIARTQSGRPAGEAIFPLTLADSIDVSNSVYSIAKDDSRPLEVRDQAIFWLSQIDNDRVVGMLDDILKSSHDERIQDKAIFGLSQQRSGKGFAILRDFAERESAPDNIREKAIFWLGQGRADGGEYLRSLYPKVHSANLKDKIIFSVSQQNDAASVKWLMDIARNDPDREARKKAMFWLGQSRDERVSAFLTDMINR